ncbi:MAG: M20/M25/M40 family metallo-hydrolase [Acidobacteria bacterium]|nr:M20/M25/M40 family metallo-hydrolase [Acidobacteriota bacterium]
MRSVLLLTVGLAAVPACTAPAPPSTDPRVAALVASISEERLEALLERLVSFDTRHTASNPDPAGRGIGAARQWIFDELARASPRLLVSFDTYQVAAQGERILHDVVLRNVAAVLPGRSPRRIYVSGHYDSIARLVDPPPSAGPPGGAGIHWNVPDSPAPGANDDGSGTVLTMELARAFAQSGIEFEATLVFIAFAGEEEGLFGAHLHAEKAWAEGAVIDAVFNNDVVGGAAGGTGAPNTDTVRVFAEGPEDSPSRQLARHIRKEAARYVPDHQVVLIARYDRFLRGGDHIAFNERGFPAIRVTEAHENYARQHRVEDTLDGVSFRYLAQNARVNAAGVATLALAPPAPRVTSETGAPTLGRGESGYDAQLRWVASPGAVSYRVYSRPAWSLDWDETVDAGNVTEHVRPNVSIDDFIFGVSAVGPGGHESLVSAYVNPARRPTTVRTVQ